MPGSTWEAVRHVGTLHSITMWEYALHATGLNINMEGNTTPSTILIPLDDSMLACKSAGEGVGFLVWYSCPQLRELLDRRDEKY